MVARTNKSGRARSLGSGAGRDTRSSSRVSSTPTSNRGPNTSKKSTGTPGVAARKNITISKSNGGLDDVDDMSLDSSGSTPLPQQSTIDNAYKYLLAFAAEPSRRPDLPTLKQQLEVVESSLLENQKDVEFKIQSLIKWKSALNGQTTSSDEPTQVKNESGKPIVDVKKEKSDLDEEMTDISAGGAASAALLSNENISLIDTQSVHEASPEEINPTTTDADAIESLELFHEEPGNTSPEYLKKYYGVSSYPTVDLKDKLPGPIPDDDFTQAKPPNQVQFSTFSAYIDPFFRPYVEEDVSFLKQAAVSLETASYGKSSILSPYLIPPLGPYYGDVWTAEDAQYDYKMSYPPNPLDKQKILSSVQPRGSEDYISDDIMETEKVSCGPLASRLLSALLKEVPESELMLTNGENDPSKNAAHFDDQQQGWKVDSVKADYASLEDRLKREFRYFGIIDLNVLHEEDRKRKILSASAPHIGSELNGNASEMTRTAINLTEEDDDDDMYDLDWVTGREDDEISIEMRSLQRKLREVTKLNQAAKRRLIPLIQEQMAYQEYTQILDDLDKQVDQAYLKRIRNIPKGKKKKAAVAAQQVAAATAAAAGGNVDSAKAGLRSLLDKRQRWIDKIGPVFRAPEIMKRMPLEPIFDKLEADEDDEYDEDENDEDNAIEM